MAHDRILERRDIYAYRDQNNDLRVPDEAECRQIELRALTRRNLAPQPADQDMVAYINHGRWVGDCACGAGVALSPGDPQSLCMECGRMYAVTFPEIQVRQQLEAALLARTRSYRNWTPGETAADLVRENEEQAALLDVDRLRSKIALLEQQLTGLRSEVEQLRRGPGSTG